MPPPDQSHLLQKPCPSTTGVCLNRLGSYQQDPHQCSRGCSAQNRTGDYREEISVTAMLRNLQLDSLQERRLRARSVMIFRVVSTIIDLSCAPLHPAGTATIGHTQRFIQPFCHVKSYQNSFYPTGTVIWNPLPQDVINANSLESFKTRISAHRFI